MKPDKFFALSEVTIQDNKALNIPIFTILGFLSLDLELILALTLALLFIEKLFKQFI